MATRTRKPAAKATTGRRSGRPTNAQRKADLQSKASQFITIAASAYADGMKAALGIDGGVTTLASLPTNIASGVGSNASPSTSNISTVATRKQKQAPGRTVDPNSKMSLTKAFYDQNLSSSSPLNRAAFVKAATEKFGYSQQTANTYVSNIEKNGGYKMQRRGNSASRGGRGQAVKKTGTA